jgi:peptidoglycan hydrolase CwlO-like protein
MEERIGRMEQSIERHDSQISKLFSRIEDTNKCIQKINNSMLQVKWSVYGAIGFYIVTQIGLIEALRL